MEKESLEVLLGLGLSVERIAKRFGEDPSTISYRLQRYGLEPLAVCAAATAARGA